MALEGLEGLIKGLENQESWQVQRQFRLVVQHWPKAVGFAVARQSRPVGIQRGTLYVATATAVWAQALAYERLKILRKLNRHQRQPLKGIRFSTAQWAQPTGPFTPRPASTDHPSYTGERPNYTERSPERQSTDGQTPEQQPEKALEAQLPQTPKEAFEQWAALVQKMQSNQAQCPQCHCCCPQGELGRWGICSLCVTKLWALKTRP